jgi:hypothetical protein
MSFRERLNYPFPFYLNDHKKNFILTLGMGVFVFVFLIFFETSGEHHLDLNLFQKMLFGVLTFFCLLFTILILPYLFPKHFNIDRWTVGKYVWHTMFNIIVIGIASTAVDELLICPERSLWLNVRGAVEQVVVIGAIPVTIISLLLRNNMLKGNLQNALRANEELQRIKSLKKEIRENAVVDSKITLRSETTETLSISLPELLFIQADSNYSTVYWKESENINKKLLRVNLKNLETQINNAYAMRCHRSFIVNVSAIDTIIGNTNGYKLTIRGTDISIPVSRHKGRDIIDKIGQLKSMMELA